MKHRKRFSTESHRPEILGILLMTLGLLIFISLVSYDPAEEPGHVRLGQVRNGLGLAGVYISHFLIRGTVGYSAIVIPILIVLWGWNRFFRKALRPLLRWSLYLVALALYTSTLLALPEAAFPGQSPLGYRWSGSIGGFLAERLHFYFGAAGSVIIMVALILIAVVGATGFSFAKALTVMGERWAALVGSLRARQALSEIEEPVTETPALEAESEEAPRIRDSEPAEMAKPEERTAPHRPTHLVLTLPSEPEEPVTLREEEIKEEVPEEGEYQFPPLELLNAPRTVEAISREELLVNARILEDRLAEFDIGGKVVNINPGPVITQYEVEPAPGVKVARFTSLADDLALAMRAKSIRVVAPIPGKGVIGVEIPNRQPATVYLRSILASEAFQQSKSPLTLALGKTISGEVYVDDLATMPHLLIAGSTGSGKSVCLNAIITSILYRAHPTEVQFVLIDPKRLELAPYALLKHHHLNYREDLREEVATTAASAIAVLRSLEWEMERRYSLLARAGVRNIEDYNAKVEKGMLPVGGEDEHRKLEYLVLIIDELADLMITAARDVEEPIARLTQMSRAVGIHLIVATQRPSVDVITGVIKANFPARIAFQVTSKTDSRTILDMNGAEKLLGRGDMLYLPPASPEPIRLHGAYISTEEVERIVDHVRRQPRFPKSYLPIRTDEQAAGETGGSERGGRDELFNEAAKIVVRHKQGSVSLLQRRLNVGYSRAARLIDQLEAAGIVGVFDGSKAREVLIDEEQLKEMGIY